MIARQMTISYLWEKKLKSQIAIFSKIQIGADENFFQKSIGSDASRLPRDT